MPVNNRESENHLRKNIILTKNLDARLLEYQKKLGKNLNLSEIIRKALDEFLRKEGF